MQASQSKELEVSHSAGSHHQDKGHKPAEDCEENVTAFIAEAATSLE